ncbi:MAG: acyltransferase [Aquihabitans sp.]
MIEPEAAPLDRAQRREKSIRYVAALDGLRALAALGVMLIHIVSHAGGSITTYVVVGSVAGPFFVLFFAISGFVLYRGWARKHLALGDRTAGRAPRAAAAGGADGRTVKYLLRRLLRIYPLYWVVATAALLVTNNATPHTPLDILQVYLLLPFPNPDALVNFGLGIVVWTLVIDVLFYLYVAIHGPVMTSLIKRLRHRHTPFSIETTVLLGMSAVILVCALFVPAPLSVLVCLPLGMWFAVIEAQQERLGRRLSGIDTMVKAWPVWIVMYMIVSPTTIRIATQSENYGALLETKPGIHMLLVFGGFLLLINVVFGPRHWPFQRFLVSPFMRTAGLLTFGTYLWHPVVLIVLRQQGIDDMFLAGVVTIVASVTLASITYFLLEKPLADLRLKMRKPDSPVPTPRPAP